MRRREVADPQSSGQGPGGDSFLDIVANLVGILIILVMVIGVRAKDAMLEAAPVTNGGAENALTQVSEPVPDPEAAKAAAGAVEHDIHQIDAKIEQEQFTIKYRKAERDRMQLVLQAAEEELQKRRQQMGAEEQAEFDNERSRLAAQRELDEIEAQVGSIESSEVPVTLLTHLPTPMAKTVFGHELHFRLGEGRLTVVPWDDLVNRLKQEAPSKLWRLKDQDEMTETLGPVGGFWMQYKLVRKQHALQTKVGVAIQQGVELDHFVLMPVEDQIGEPLSEALQDGSALNSLLAGRPPGATTVTVWTYPDSFREFRQLKEYLFARGYLTACRPLPEDYPIGGSPDGSRSASQ